ncbi:MAG: L-arabinose transport system permease protein AraQ [Chloroflexi bacterium ADurb.Bin325]|nr:MAG: L-arabinose transport system permease protein AraQ [Chloroflexi bacterium ADurb.Bin325]
MAVSDGLRTPDPRSNWPRGMGLPTDQAFPAYRVLRPLGTLLLHIVLIAGGLLFVFPLYWLVTTSLKSDAQLFVFPPPLIPNPFIFTHYGEALKSVPLLPVYFLNTAMLTGLNLAGALISCTMVAYAFARYNAPGSRILFALLLATMMLPGQVTMIPLFLVFRGLGWIGTFRPLWVPAFFGNAFLIFLLRQFFSSIPKELFDAARIDGCGEFGQFWRIMLPLTKPALTTLAIFQFQWTWNDFMGPLIYISKQNMKTIALGLQDFYKTNSVLWQQLMAASTLMVLPIVLLFFFLQRYFIEGIALTGLKG